MQNKPNLKNAQISVTSAIEKTYGNIRPYSQAQNKPNQTQFTGAPSKGGIKFSDFHSNCNAPPNMS
jgi:hypothetical protein